MRPNRDSAVRLDTRLRLLHPNLSWMQARRAITRGQVTVDGTIERDPACEVSSSSDIEFDPSRRALPSARLALPRLYEDDEILVIDKPAGLLTIATDSGSRAHEDTVLRRVQEYARHLHGRRAYAGVLHRLDRGTSGALALALSRQAHVAGRALFGSHAYDRHYLAIVEGVPTRNRGTIDARISNRYVSGRRKVVDREREGRRAITHYIVREAFEAAALIELRLETGRQHQIRLHLQQLGHPIAGDEVYADEAAGKAKGLRASRPMLHAWRLQFPHPLRDTRIKVEAPIPEDFERVLARLRIDRAKARSRGRV